MTPFQPLCAMLYQYITRFRHLQSLDLFMKEKPAVSMSNGPDLARTFGEHCPSLRSIRFSPSSFHAYCPSGNWVSVQGLHQRFKEAMSLFALATQPLCAEGSTLTDSLEFSVSTLRVLRDISTSLKNLKSTLGNLEAGMEFLGEGTTLVRSLDAMSPVLDAELSSSISLAFEACSGILRAIGGRVDDVSAGSL